MSAPSMFASVNVPFVPEIVHVGVGVSAHTDAPAIGAFAASMTWPAIVAVCANAGGAIAMTEPAASRDAARVIVGRRAPRLVSANAATIAPSRTRSLRMRMAYATRTAAPRRVHETSTGDER